MVETLQGSFLQILGTRRVILGLPHKKRDKLGLNRHLRFKKKWFYYWQFWYGMIDVDVSCHNFGWGATELYNCWNDCSKQSKSQTYMLIAFPKYFYLHIIWDSKCWSCSQRFNVYRLNTPLLTIHPACRIFHHIFPCLGVKAVNPTYSWLWVCVKTGLEFMCSWKI